MYNRLFSPRIRLVGQTMPAAILSVPSLWLSISSLRRLRRTTRHVERATRDEHEVIRRIRRDRQSGHHSFQLSEPPVVFDGSAPPFPGRQTTDPPATEPTRHGFRLPFLRHLTNTSPHPSLNSLDDGRTSIASSSFPTFAPAAKPGFAEHGAADDLGVADPPWVDADSTAPTSNEGHETSDVLDFDVKTQNDDNDGTHRFNYPENVTTPSSMFELCSFSPLF